MQTQMSTKITWESYLNADSESAALGTGKLASLTSPQVTPTPHRGL